LIARNTNDGPVWRVGLVLAAFVLAFTEILFGLVVRRVLARNSARASAWTALILGVVAVLSLAVLAGAAAGVRRGRAGAGLGRP
jgi:hypothetical protein